MEYLQSLVGKDQETITNAIKEMAENTQKVKIQEKKITDLQTELLENRDEIHYLKNKINQKYDMIDDMEHDLDKNKEELKDLKKQIESKDYKVNALEKLILDQVDEINILRDNNQSMVVQISENIRMEKKLNVQDAVIKDLAERLKVGTNEETDEETERLILEVKHLEIENGEKLKLLQIIELENTVLKEKLDYVQKNEEIEEHFARIFKCKECDENFATRGELKHHKRIIHGEENSIPEMKLKLHKIEKQISDQKLDLTVKIFKLKEDELNEKETCKCVWWCAISHQKHSWKKSSSKELFSRFESLTKMFPQDEKYTCNTCEEFFSNGNLLETHRLIHENVCHECDYCKHTFSSPDDFVVHMENNHKEADVLFLDRNLH